ncbi:MAG TPA: RNA methyltransferase [Armatimonadetes bacterium]|nr:RNA methyltransferase [Armatimonadota bacterium]
MVIYGRHPVREALRANVKLREVIIANGVRLSKDLSALIERNVRQVRVVTRKQLTQITNSDEHQGIAADIGEFPLHTVRELLQIALAPHCFCLAIDHIQDPRNAGSLIRSAEALGATGVIMTARRTVGITPAFVKASAGACFHIPIAIGNLRRFAVRFKEHGGFVVALDMSGENIRDAQKAYPLLLVVGAEGKGISQSILNIADAVWCIPQVGRIEALNAAVAGAIAMWEVVRDATCMHLAIHRPSSSA